MANYKEPFDSRIEDTTAEDYFEEFCTNMKIDFYHYGIKDHKFGNKFFKVKRIIRNTPDYIVMNNDACLVEVKGTWDIVKMKEKDINSYKVWNNKMKLYYFFYSTKHKEHKFISHNQLMMLLPLCDTDYYPDANEYDDKLYYKILWSSINEV